jgi:hypothetical protein
MRLPAKRAVGTSMSAASSTTSAAAMASAGNGLRAPTEPWVSTVSCSPGPGGLLQRSAAMKVWATPVGQAVTATISARRCHCGRASRCVSSWALAAASSRKPSRSARAWAGVLGQALADETGQVHRPGADHSTQSASAICAGRQAPLGVLGILHFDTGAPASTLGRGGQQARSAHSIPGRWGRR